MIIFERKLKTSPKHKVDRKQIDVRLISNSLSHGDWCLCYNIMKNMDAVTYAEWLKSMTELLRSASPPSLRQSVFNTF